MNQSREQTYVILDQKKHIRYLNTASKQNLAQIKIGGLKQFNKVFTHPELNKVLEDNLKSFFSQKTLSYFDEQNDIGISSLIRNGKTIYIALGFNLKKIEMNTLNSIEISLNDLDYLRQKTENLII